MSTLLLCKKSFDALQVARRVRSVDHVSKTSEPGGKRKAVRYQCACLEEHVYLHPQSSLYSAAPEFVTYTALIRSTKRPYMTGYIPPPTVASHPKYPRKDPMFDCHDCVVNGISYTRSQPGQSKNLFLSRVWDHQIAPVLQRSGIEAKQCELQ